MAQVTLTCNVDAIDLERGSELFSALEKCDGLIVRDQRALLRIMNGVLNGLPVYQPEPPMGEEADEFEDFTSEAPIARRKKRVAAIEPALYYKMGITSRDAALAGSIRKALIDQNTGRIEPGWREAVKRILLAVATNYEEDT